MNPTAKWRIVAYTLAFFLMANMPPIAAAEETVTIGNQKVPISATELNLSNLEITDLSPLAALTELIDLDLSGNPIADLSPLMGLKKLEYLYLMGTKIEDLTPLVDLYALRFVDVTDCLSLSLENMMEANLALPNSSFFDAGTLLRPPAGSKFYGDVIPIRFSNHKFLKIPKVTKPFVENGVPAAHTKGREFAICGDTLALISDKEKDMAVRVFTRQDGKVIEKAIYPEDLWISDLILWEDGMAYLTATTNSVGESETIYLVTVDQEGRAKRVPVGPQQWDEGPYTGPVLRLSDGSILLTDGYGIPFLCDSDGSNMRQISDIRMDDYTVSGETIYFANERDQVHKIYYHEEYDEFSVESGSCLYRMALDGSHVEKVTDYGIEGLDAQGEYVLYQNLNDPYRWPDNSVMVDYQMNGGLYCLNTSTQERYPMYLDSALYMPTPYGLAAYLPGIMAGDDEGCGYFALVLSDWNGKILHELDASNLFWYSIPWALEESGISFFYHNTLDEQYELFTVPLDGAPRTEPETT